MKQIALTQEKYALVDDEDYERLNRFKWHAHKRHNIFYAGRSLTVIKGKKYTVIHMHHEIIGRPPKGFEADHRNGRGLDNQRHNLRHVTSRQNKQNRKNGKKKTSKYPGVYWKKDKRKWKAEIQINGKSKFLGYFTNEKEAFEAYRQAVEAIGEEVIS